MIIIHNYLKIQVSIIYTLYLYLEILKKKKSLNLFNNLNLM